jgi:hypothetical protein
MNPCPPALLPYLEKAMVHNMVEEVTADVLTEIDARIAEMTRLREVLEGLENRGDESLVRDGIEEANRLLTTLRSKRDLLVEANMHLQALVGTK